MSFEHLFPATAISPDAIIDEASTAEGAERLLTQLGKDHPYYSYVAAGIAEHYAKNGDIKSADRLVHEIPDEIHQAHVETEMVFFEQDHPDERPIPLEKIEKDLYETAVAAYEHNDSGAAANVLLEAAEALPNTDMPQLAKKAQAEHPEIKPDLGDELDDNDLIDLV